MVLRSLMILLAVAMLVAQFAHARRSANADQQASLAPGLPAAAARA